MISKESLKSEKTIRGGVAGTGKRMKDESMFSDYFFHPVEQESSNIQALEELINEREQLPIRVFLDAGGRLKYWESRTYILDRKGNFMTPNIA